MGNSKLALNIREIANRPGHLNVSVSIENNLIGLHWLNTTHSIATLDNAFASANLDLGQIKYSASNKAQLKMHPEFEHIKLENWSNASTLLDRLKDSRTTPINKMAALADLNKMARENSKGLFRFDVHELAHGRTSLCFRMGELSAELEITTPKSEILEKISGAKLNVLGGINFGEQGNSISLGDTMAFTNGLNEPLSIREGDTTVALPDLAAQQIKRAAFEEHIKRKRADPEYEIPFAKLVLRGCDLSGMDLSGIDFGNADLLNVNMDDTNLEGANLSQAWTNGATFDRVPTRLWRQY